ncbi:MOSC domain-containing protein [Herpetosiphon sp. NSE202]|uniref:MOSC domain-containing protein n=1 Tax=Herpetosiphon sp. NSE202 TaxID=3351349 RepID=UPI00362F9A44
MIDLEYVPMETLEAGLDHIRQAPKNQGVLQLIVRRPASEQREVLDQGQLDLGEGLVGDNWKTRGSSRTEDGSSHPDMQLNIINVRAIGLLSPDQERWQLAGDQLFVDLDLSDENLPAGTRLAIGDAIIEVTDQPHNGCKKFAQRYGQDAIKFVNSAVGKELHLRGINARVVQPGTIRQGDIVSKI